MKLVISFLVIHFVLVLSSPFLAFPSGIVVGAAAAKTMVATWLLLAA